MNYNLTAEQDMIVRSLRAFREQELEPHEAEVDRSGEVPPELGARIKQRALEMGFTRPTCRRKSVVAGSTTRPWRCSSASWARPVTGCMVTFIALPKSCSPAVGSRSKNT